MKLKTESLYALVHASMYQQLVTGNNHKLLQANTIGYKLLKKIREDRFDEDSLHQYDLLIQISVRDFQIGIIDSSDNKVLYFEDYVLSDLSTHQELHHLFKTLFDSHSLLNAGFWNSVIISTKSNKFVQVPAALFLEEALQEYLQFNANIDPETEDFLFCKNKNADIYTVFAIQKDLHHWLKQIYSNTRIQFVHQASALIDGVLEQVSNDANKLYVYVDRFKLHIIYTNEGKLIYYNQFVIKQFSDYVKYIMLVLKSFSIDQQASEIVLWGYIGKNSPHYQEFIKYIKNVTFGRRPSYLKFGYIFDDMQDHHFFDLFSINLLKSSL